MLLTSGTERWTTKYQVRISPLRLDTVRRILLTDLLSKMANVTGLIKSPTFLAKILELVLCSLAIVLFMSDTSYLVTVKSKWAVVFGTLIGFIMISIIVIVGSVLNPPPHRTLMMMIALPAAFMFFSTGGIIIETWYHATRSTGYLIGSGILAFITGFIYLGDFALAFFNYG